MSVFIAAILLNGESLFCFILSCKQKCAKFGEHKVCMEFWIVQECCSCANCMQALCKIVKTYLRNISGEKVKSVSINLGTWLQLSSRLGFHR